MSFVVAVPELMAAAATDLSGLGSQISEATAAAAAPTMQLLAAGADEVSTAIAALFSGHARAYQALSTEAAAWHTQFGAGPKHSRGVLRSDGVCQRLVVAGG